MQKLVLQRDSLQELSYKHACEVHLLPDQGLQ